jgi:hypothetical protein
MSLGLTVVTLCVPRLDLVAKRGTVFSAVCKALTTQMAEFDLGHVEPTPMLWSIMDVSWIG